MVNLDEEELSVKRILGTYLEPSVCKILFVTLKQDWQIGCNLEEKQDNPPQ